MRLLVAKESVSNKKMSASKYTDTQEHTHRHTHPSLHKRDLLRDKLHT